MSTGNDQRVRLDAERITWRRVENEIVVLDLAESTYLSINGTGAFLWPLLEEGASRSSLTDALTVEFAVDNETASRDVEDFVADLHARGILVSE